MLVLASRGGRSAAKPDGLCLNFGHGSGEEGFPYDAFNPNLKFIRRFPKDEIDAPLARAMVSWARLKCLASVNAPAAKS